MSVLAEGRRRAAVAFIFVTVTLDIVAGGVIGPVWPNLVTGFLGGSTSRAAAVFGVFATVFAAAQLIFAPILGSLSDRYGRRPVILLSCAGLGIDYLIMATAPNIVWLFVGRTLAGIASANMAAASAYIADVTPPEKRAGAFGILSAAFGIGFILGPMLGGLLGQFHPRLPFVVAAGLSFLNAAYGWFILPESLAKENRAPFSIKMANPIAAMGILGSKPQLIGLSWINFIARLIHAVFGTVWSLYGFARYHWGPGMIGVSMAVVGASSLVVSAGLVRPTVARIGERMTMMLGLFFGALGFALMAWAPQGWIFLAAIGPLCLWGLATPPIQSMMTRQVLPTEQGRLQGATAGITSIAGLIGPALFASSFTWASTPSHVQQGLIGLPYDLAALLMLLAVILAWRVTAGQATEVRPAAETSPP
jgi:DHA1 family tetracycline resistance protein-like MFS transporter